MGNNATKVTFFSIWSGTYEQSTNFSTSAHSLAYDRKYSPLTEEQQVSVFCYVVWYYQKHKTTLTLLSAINVS